jgi:hypothetical protein
MKYFSVEVICDYNEIRVVAADNASDAALKVQNGDHQAVYHQKIGDIKSIGNIGAISNNDIRPLLNQLSILI